MQDERDTQAERIKELVDSAEDLQLAINELCDAIPGYEWCGGAAKEIAAGFAERDTLRAQIAAIAATEPVTYQYRNITEEGPSEVWWNTNKAELEFIAAKKHAIEWRGLFTRPMPAQDVTELVEALSALVDCITETRGTHADAALVKAHAALSKYKGAK